MSLVVVVACAAGGWTWLARGDTPSTSRITATVARGTYKTTVSATGTITPTREEDLSFSSAGTVTRVAVSVGDKVHKGDLLARIDTTSLQAQLDAAEAQVTAARTQLSEDGDASSTQRAADRASLASAESDLDEVVVTDTIPLSPEGQQCPKIRQLSCAQLLAETMTRISNEESVSSLFTD